MNQFGYLLSHEFVATMNGYRGNNSSRLAKRKDIIWNCRICDTQAENEDTILEHIRDRHGSVDRRNDPSPIRVSDVCDVNLPFIKRF